MSEELSNLRRDETMTSLQIAEITGKQHKDVLEAIRKMEPAWEAVRGRKFPLTFRITKLPNCVGQKRTILGNERKIAFVEARRDNELNAILR